LQELGKQVIDIAHAGLSARGQVNSMGDNETAFLNPLRQIVDSGMSPAHQLLEKYKGEWNGDLSRVYDELSF
jgi:glutamate--cysteine ligase